MNKYEKYWHSTEGKHQKISKLKSEKLKIMLYKYLYKKYGLKGIIDSKKIDKKDLIKQIVISLDFFSEDMQKWVRENIIVHLNSKNIIGRFITYLTNQATKNNAKLASQFAKCFVKTGVIKNILYEEGIFKLETLSGRIIKFSKKLNSKDAIEEMTGYCHHIMNDYFKKFQNDNNSYCVTILDRGLYGEPMYHSFLLHHGMVNDYARNFIMSWEDYKYLFEPEIIMCIPGKQLLTNIERLKKKDKDFKDSKYSDVLKYAIHKQMKKEKRI